jgi:pimeloyl-ACP methyl ester carboxylesterase
MKSTLRTRSNGLGVLRDGAGTDVLLIGGLADDASVWDAQIPALIQRHRVARYDARGVGGSPTPPGPYRLAELVADALEVLDAAEMERAHLVGSSLGGAVAQRLAIDHPERVRTLTLSGSWVRADRAFRALLSSWIWAAERAGGVGELMQTVNRWAYGADAWNSGAVDEAIARAAIAEVRAGRQAWRWFQDAFTWTTWAALEHDSAAELPGVDVPSLVIVGAQDAILGERHSRELADLLGGRLEIVPGSGHQPFQERSIVFNGLLTGFLAVNEAREVLAA